MIDDVMTTNRIAFWYKGIEVRFGMSVQNRTIFPYCSIIRHFFRLRINLCINVYYHLFIVLISSIFALPFLSCYYFRLQSMFSRIGFLSVFNICNALQKYELNWYEKKEIGKNDRKGEKRQRKIEKKDMKERSKESSKERKRQKDSGCCSSSSENAGARVYVREKGWC